MKITTWDNENMGVEIVVEGTTTIATINANGVWARGRAKLNPADHYDEKLGEKIAVARASAKWFSKLEKILVRSALTEEQYSQKQIATRKAKRIIMELLQENELAGV